MTCHPFAGIIQPENVRCDPIEDGASSADHRRTFLRRVLAIAAAAGAAIFSRTAAAQTFYGPVEPRGEYGPPPGSAGTRTLPESREPSRRVLPPEGERRMTTQALGEEGSGGPVTTQALGEEGSRGPVTTRALGEEGSRGPTYTTQALGEEAGPRPPYRYPDGYYTTYALGEEGAYYPPRRRRYYYYGPPRR